ncbi:MAG: threonine synthase [Phycisphaerae bacterium]|nr:threonine synthase [Phycisphaerae bacterium]
MTKEQRLVSTISGREYPFERIEEFAENGESLEVRVCGIETAKVRAGVHLWERFADWMPFDRTDAAISLGEGDTPLIPAGGRLQAVTGIKNLLLKNETQNPTWSFKDRGSLMCVLLARELGEDTVATISTGNMGHSIAAYAANAGLRAVVFVPPYTPQEKLMAMAMHGARVIRVAAPDYTQMKNTVLELAGRLKLRIVSGNGPIRVEGYKLIAFEMFEQMGRQVPDFIAIPTSACGHIRGIFKGYRELQKAGLIDRLPRMIVVQARNCSPVVTAIKQGFDHVVPFTDFDTVAEAITSGNPPGGDEILDKARRCDWPAEDVSEEEILQGQRDLARAGFFVEPSAATSLPAVRRLVDAGRLSPDATVVLMLTGAGLKDLDALKHQPCCGVIDTDVESVEADVAKLLNR